MSITEIILTGLSGIRDYISPWIAFLVLLLSFFAFWPRLKASIIGKLTSENMRLRGLIADMTLELEIKNVIRLADKKEKDGLNAEIDQLKLTIVGLHRKDFDQLHHTKNPEGPDR